MNSRPQRSRLTRSHWNWAVLLLICISLTPSVWAQSSASEESDADVFLPLEIAQLSFHRSLLESTLNPLKEHLSDLQQLTSGLAEQRRYEEAMLSQKEHRQMEVELDRISKEILLLQSKERALRSSLLPDRILLPLDQASLQGVVLDESGTALTRWERIGDFAEWRLPDLPPGGYEVVVTYECSAIEGGQIEVAESRFTLSAEMDTTLRGPESKSIGTLKVSDGSGRLRVTARSVIRGSLMHLREVCLIPANR